MVQSVDFERVLRCSPYARTAHFSAHFLASLPTQENSSTSEEKIPQIWLGMVVASRYAPRSVTRMLLKRQIRQAVFCFLSKKAEDVPTMRSGLWVVRLAACFDPKIYPCAASRALRRVASQELNALLTKAVTILQ